MKNEKLTQREKELMKQLKKGLSRKLAADACGMTKRTADTHLKNIFLKLDVHSITGALNKLEEEDGSDTDEKK